MNTKTLGLFIVAILISGTVGYSIHYMKWLDHHDPQVHVNMEVQFIDALGNVETHYAGNLITNIGERYVRNILGFNNVTGHNATKWISVGNGTPSVTMTKLTTETTTGNFSRALGTVSSWENGTDYAYNVTYLFMANAMECVESAMLHWSDVSNSDNNGFAVAFLTDGTDHQFPTGSYLRITWVITIDAN